MTARSRRSLSRVELYARVQEWSDRLRVRPAVVRVRPMKRKWGSCSAKGTITLSTSLLRVSNDFREYVIVHELLHLRLKNHGRLFKSYLSTYCPGWKRHEVWALRRTGR